MNKLSDAIGSRGTRKDIEFAHNDSKKWSNQPRCIYRDDLICGGDMELCQYCRETLFMPSPAELGQKVPSSW